MGLVHESNKAAFELVYQYITGPCDPAFIPCHLSRIQQYAKNHIVFRNDPPILYFGKPVPTELIKTPDQMLAEINQFGHTVEDCDGFAVFTASILYNNAIPAGFCAVAAEDRVGRLSHVFCVAKWRGQIFNMDASTAKMNWKGYRGKIAWL